MRAYPIAAIGVLIVLAAVATAGTIRVDLGGQGDYSTIQEGIDAAADGDTVLVAAGRYTGPLNRDIELRGKTIVLTSEAGREETTIDCENVSRGFLVYQGESPNTVVQGFTVTNGSAEEGGALWCGTTSARFVDCAFTNNSGTFGGAVYCGLEAWTSFEQCVFSGNDAEDYGGAVYTHGARPYILECEFSENTAGINGGAISCKTGSVAMILDSWFVGNSSTDGGAIYVGTLFGWSDDNLESSTIGYSFFENNTAIRGGAVFLNSYSWVTTMWCTFQRNSAQEGGAVFVRTDAEGSFTIQSCTLVYNDAEYGGCICSSGYSAYSDLLITQTIMSFSTQGNSVHRLDYSNVWADLSLAFGNDGGDELIGSSRNLFIDPLFCDVAGGDYNLCENSPCRGSNNPWGFPIGSYRQICGPCSSPVEETSWGAIKAMYR